MTFYRGHLRSVERGQHSFPKCENFTIFVVFFLDYLEFFSDVLVWNLICLLLVILTHYSTIWSALTLQRARYFKWGLIISHLFVSYTKLIWRQLLLYVDFYYAFVWKRKYYFKMFEKVYHLPIFWLYIDDYIG